MFGAWRPKLSGMRRWDGSYCVFRKMGPRKRDVTTTPRRPPVFTQSPSRVMLVWCVATRAQCNAAPDCLELRIRKSGPPIGDIHPRGLRDSHGRYVQHNGIRPLDAWRHEQSGDAPSDCPTLRIRKMGPSNRQVRLWALQYRRGGFVHRDRMRLIDVCERESLWMRL